MVVHICHPRHKRIWVQGQARTKTANAIQKYILSRKGIGGKVQVEEYLPIKQDFLSSNTSIQSEKKVKQGKKEELEICKIYHKESLSNTEHL
jgi:hypothetical protein